LSGETTDFS